ncbi:MAG: response regulator transcription factor [Anaerolineales bacterium]|jgi:RNA polymerase sigma factor (sigma-70 family)
MHTVLIVDDHILFREGLRNIIGHWENFKVVGEASDGIEALEMARELLPDLILMDIAMPNMDGIEATRRLTRCMPACKVVILTMSEEENNLFDAIKGGAKGYVLKDTPSKRLRTQLRGVLMGEAPISGLMASKILKEFRGQQVEQAGDCKSSSELLSERERQVLERVAQGMTNAQIAEVLYLSENTVKKHLHNILEKLQLNNRVEAALYAVHQGLVE